MCIFIINDILHGYVHLIISLNTYTSSCTYTTYYMYIFTHSYYIIHVYLHVEISYNQWIYAMCIVVYDHIEHHRFCIIYYIRYILNCIVYIIYYIFCIIYYILLEYMVYHIKYIAYKM